MSTVIIHIEKLAGIFLEVTNILMKVRKYRKEWERTHDSQILNRVKFWEEKADKLIISLAIENPMVEKVNKVIVDEGLLEQLKAIEMDELHFLADSIKKWINSKLDNNELPAA